MRLTTRTSLAVRALIFCAVNPDRIVRKHEVAAAYNASENHLAQVINLLAQRGFVQTQRGRSGGMRLARPKEEIGLGTVMRMFESGVPFTECEDETASTCPLTGACRFRMMLDRALAAFYATLDEVTIADLVEEDLDLDALLAARPLPATDACPDADCRIAPRHPGEDTGTASARRPDEAPYRGEGPDPDTRDMKASIPQMPDSKACGLMHPPAAYGAGKWSDTASDGAWTALCCGTGHGRNIRG